MCGNLELCQRGRRTRRSLAAGTLYVHQHGSDMPSAQVESDGGSASSYQRGATVDSNMHKADGGCYVMPFAQMKWCDENELQRQFTWMDMHGGGERAASSCMQLSGKGKRREGGCSNMTGVQRERRGCVPPMEWVERVRGAGGGRQLSQEKSLS